VIIAIWYSQVDGTNKISTYFNVAITSTKDAQIIIIAKCASISTTKFRRLSNRDLESKV
jgi:hypothetical protein